MLITFEEYAQKLSVIPGNVVKKNCQNERD
jgi:hypothetical protein